MAILIKSDTTVVNADRDFNYYSEHGLVDKQTFDFIDGLSKSGYTLSSTEFAAIKTFRDNLIYNRVWDDVYEVYPLMGNSAASAAVKLKSLTGKSKMLPQYGLDDSLFEYSGGKILGKKVTTTSIDTQPSFDTQLKSSELPTPYVGFHFYMGEAVPHASGLDQPVVGSKTISNSKNAAYTAVSVNMYYDSAYIHHRSSTAGTTSFDNTMSLYSFVSKPNEFNISAVASYYRNGTLVNSSDASALTTPNTLGETPIAFFGSSAPYPDELVSSNGYSGKIRFGCITSGTLSDSDIKLLNDEITILLTALGKTV